MAYINTIQLEPQESAQALAEAMAQALGKALKWRVDGTSVWAPGGGIAIQFRVNSTSVVPGINYTLEHMIADYFHMTPHIVGPGIKTGLNILYETPREVGADRIVNAVSAYERWGGPVIIIDFGTATTFSAVSEKGEFLGGAICPGVKVSMEALVRNTAKLPTVELVRPTKVINRTTTLNMQAGIVYGCAGQVAYIVSKMRQEMERPDAKVVATGGLAHLISAQLSIGMHVDPLLTLKGLEILYRKNTQGETK